MNVHRERDSLLLKAVKSLLKLKFSTLIFNKLDSIAHKFNVDEMELLKLYVDLKNKANRVKFSLVPYAERILLLPQCLRSSNCPAELGDFGYNCIDCGKCMIGKVYRFALKLGYKGVFIIPGGSMIAKIFEKVKPKACLGVACFKELFLGSFLCEKFGVVGQGIPLLRDGCINTLVDWKKLFNFIAMIST
ncbi:MAG: DUF116 domain-containing protein [archaeon GB-1867-097]|nr:DUF116 domain-containing protein [Candidatus Verstraetearchaeota archaeon]MCS7374268.1 DUF116 domain-containing protein [Candidatus Culexmicrobium thermophilum]MCS7384245.1 DUF116 domain-containing protein [Candidatus Culexmicrobium thermophilum]